MMGPTLAVLALRGELAPDAVSLKSDTDGSETRMCGAPGGRSEVGRRLPRRADCCPPPIPCCLASVCSAACSACQSNVTWLSGELNSRYRRHHQSKPFIEIA